MARFSGLVGYAVQNVETAPGVYEDTVVEHLHYGDVKRNTLRIANGEDVNSDLSVGNSISIVADEYANGQFHNIRYVRWAGALWEVAEVTVERPRLVLRLGGVYNGITPSSP